MSRTALDPLFTTADTTAFTDRHIAALATGTLAAVRVPGFLDDKACAHAASAAARLPTRAYDRARVPTPIQRFGPSLNDYRTPDGLDHDRYWADADAARAAWTRLALRPDPVAVALARIGSGWGAAVGAATINGRPVFGGTLRAINHGTRIHWDDVTREFPHGLFDQAVTAQLAFNLWVTAPPSGGATTIWRRRWEPADQTHRADYGYTSAVVTGHQHVTITPRAGDALLFAPGHYHAVDPIDPTTSGSRIAFAFFLGLTTTGNLVLWS
jgi:hypothetical protein